MNTALHPLAATDLSAPSQHAAQRAAMLARQFGGRLELVHVLEKSALVHLRLLFGQGGEAVEENVRQQAQQALAQMADELASATEPLRVTCHLLDGAVLTTVTEQADLLGCNLVVVGARGAGFMRRWVLGATAERLLRKTRHPILVVKEPPRQDYRVVLVAVDFSAWSLRAIALAHQLAPHAQLMLLHACELPFEGKMRFAGVDEDTIRQHRETTQRQALASLHALAMDAHLTPAQWRPLVAFANPPDYILEQEEEQSADLIVMGKHGMGMSEELLLGSVAKHVLSQAHSDVLVVVR